MFSWYFDFSIPPWVTFEKWGKMKWCKIINICDIRVFFFHHQMPGTWDRIWRNQRNRRYLVELRRSYLQHYCSEWFLNWNTTQVLSENAFSDILVRGIMIRIPVAYLSLPRFQGNPQIGDLIDVYHPTTVGPRVEGESIRVKTVVLFFFSQKTLNFKRL